MRALLAAVLACALTTWGRATHANGRYPTSQFLLVGPGSASEVLVLRTTFGLVESLDGGRTWEWLCEDLFDYGNGPPYDPPIALGSRGPDGVPLLAGLTDGVSRTTNLCTSTRVPELDREFTGDLTSIGDGATMLWVASNGGDTRNRIFASQNGGRSFAALNDGTPGVLFETIEIAASNPMRVYVAGVTNSEPQRPALYRSDDGGRTLREVTLDLHGGRDAFISGIDPTNPDVLYLRSTLEDGDGGIAGTLLLRSRDGGAHFDVMLQTRGAMLGFALSGDGRTVWAGGPDERDRLMRSDDGGAFTRVSDTQVLCLRWHPSGLYVCANHIADHFAVGRSDDRGQHFTPLLRFEDLTGPSPSCPARTVARDLCTPRWAQVRRLLGIPDPTTVDAGTPLDSSAPLDASTPLDASVSIDATVPPPAAPPSCSCVVGPAKRPSATVFLALAGALALRRRKR